MLTTDDMRAVPLFSALEFDALEQLARSAEEWGRAAWRLPSFINICGAMLQRRAVSPKRGQSSATSQGHVQARHARSAHEARIGHYVMC